MLGEIRSGVDGPSQEVWSMRVVPFEEEHGLWPVRSHGQASEPHTASLQKAGADKATSLRKPISRNELELVEFMLGILLILLIAVGVVLW